MNNEDEALGLTEVETRMGFAVLCIEATAKQVGCSYKDMYQRMKRVGLMQAFTHRLDPLHTQSREYVVNDILRALARLEEKQKGDAVC